MCAIIDPSDSTTFAPFELAVPAPPQSAHQQHPTELDEKKTKPNKLICLQALPAILEDPPNRARAQSEGLASVVLRGMAAFPDNPMLQLAAFHALVVLLRPLGGDGGSAAFGSAAVGRRDRDDAAAATATAPATAVLLALDLSSSRGGGPRWEEGGVRVMLGTLRRHSSDRYLQAMGCWAMVNAALYPALKTSLLRLGGVYAVTNAMMMHPEVEAVQFRGLFALINLVIPGE